MSATNSTANYHFPQFIADDVPSWLVDFNGAMSDIDSAIKSVSDKTVKNDTDLQAVEKSIANINDVNSEQTKAISGLETRMTNAENANVTNSTNVQSLQNRVTNVEKSLDTVSATAGKVYRGTLSKGETTLAIGIDAFNANTLVDVFASVYGIAPKTMELRTQTSAPKNICVTTWDKQSVDVNVAVLIR